ncbi:MAG: hypothetical protein VKJ04_09400 [Vampirovibrionales bacterium]|nr:hypothetical protein [Vampirovibrionales bacterium]
MIAILTRYLADNPLSTFDTVSLKQALDELVCVDLAERALDSEYPKRALCLDPRIYTNPLIADTVQNACSNVYKKINDIKKNPDLFKTQTLRQVLEAAFQEIQPALIKRMLPFSSFVSYLITCFSDIAVFFPKPIPVTIAQFVDMTYQDKLLCLFRWGIPEFIAASGYRGEPVFWHNATPQEKENGIDRCRRQTLTSTLSWQNKPDSVEKMKQQEWLSSAVESFQQALLSRSKLMKLEDVLLKPYFPNAQYMRAILVENIIRACFSTSEPTFTKPVEKALKNLANLPDNAILFENKLINLTSDEFSFLKACSQLRPGENLDSFTAIQYSKHRKQKLKESIVDKLKKSKAEIFVAKTNHLTAHALEGIHFYFQV